MPIRLDIVIVNYRTPKLTVECLHSLVGEAARLPGLRVWAVDNNSGDGSPEIIQQAVDAHGWQDWVKPMPLDYNGGFSAGNNAAIWPAMHSADKPDYVFLLNPDTVVKPGAVVDLVAFMEAHPQVGIAGSKLLNAQEQPEPSAHQGLTPLSELDAGARLGVLSRLLKRHVATLPVCDTPMQCDWISGAAFMIRRAVLEQVGYLDEGYFLYFDEVDYCMRARRAGWQVWYVPSSVIIHLEGASTGIVQVKRRAPYWFKSRRRYFAKSFGVSGLLAADVGFALGRLSLVTRKTLRMGGDLRGTPKLFAWDLLWGDLKAVLSGRLVDADVFSGEPAESPRRVDRGSVSAIRPSHGAPASPAAGPSLRPESAGANP
jgi:hypothetical protein